jgi:hypothetical protein
LALMSLAVMLCLGWVSKYPQILSLLNL